MFSLLTILLWHLKEQILQINCIDFYYDVPRKCQFLFVFDVVWWLLLWYNYLQNGSSMSLQFTLCKRHIMHTQSGHFFFYRVREREMRKSFLMNSQDYFLTRTETHADTNSLPLSIFLFFLKLIHCIYLHLFINWHLFPSSYCTEISERWFLGSWPEVKNISL